MQEANCVVSIDDDNEHAAERQRRLQSLKKELRRTFLSQPRDRALADELNELISDEQLVAEAMDNDLGGRLVEGRALVILGESGAGKSRSIHRALSDRFGNYQVANAPTRLISITAPSPCTLKQLGASVLRATGYETKRDLKENVVWAMVRRRLKDLNIRFLHIDELQHAVQMKSDGEIQKVRDTLKGLMQTPEWSVSLILSGLPELAVFIQGDTQVRRRCRFIRFEPLVPGRDAKKVGTMIRNLARRADVSADHVLASTSLALRLIHAASAQFGIAIELAQDAILAAVREGHKQLTLGHFATTYYARTGCAPSENIFSISADFLLIDPQRALEDAPKTTTSAEGAPKRPKDKRNA